MDTLASTASFIAITSVLIGWYQSARKPLKIKRVIVHTDDDGSTFILETINCKDYQVSINRIDCYRRKIYEIMKKTGSSPEYSEHLTSRDAIFMTWDSFEVPAKAFTHLRINKPGKEPLPKQLIFTLHTSHGYHELRCSNITEVEGNNLEVFSVDYRNEYNSKISAKTVFYWRTLKELMKR
jgi:hypothetical protein